MKARDDVLQRLYLTQELEISVSVVKSGLAVLQQSRLYKANHFVFLTLLSTGIERLLKVILHLHAIETTGGFLPKQKVRDVSHDILKLREEVVEKCFTQEYLKKPVAKQDLDFLSHDDTLNKMLSLLSDFAKRDRYVYMDGISIPGITAEWPNRRWEELENGTIPDDERIRLRLDDKHELVKLRATQYLVLCLERLLRALARLFTLSSFR